MDEVDPRPRRPGPGRTVLTGLAIADDVSVAGAAIGARVHGHELAWIRWIHLEQITR